MDISHTVDDDKITNVALRGDVDIVVADELLARLSAVVDDDATIGVVIDMSRVRFWDSSGVGALVAAARRATGSGKSLVIGAMSEQVRQILQITGLLDLLAPDYRPPAPTR